MFMFGQPCDHVRGERRNVNRCRDRLWCAVRLALHYLQAKKHPRQRYWALSRRDLDGIREGEVWSRHTKANPTLLPCRYAALDGPKTP